MPQQLGPVFSGSTTGLIRGPATPYGSDAFVDAGKEENQILPSGTEQP